MSARARTLLLLLCSAGAARAGGEAGSGARPLQVECNGPVEWTAGDAGTSRLVLTGGVRATSGDMILRSRRAELALSDGSGLPEVVHAEGGVTLTSPRFAAEAGSADLRSVPGGGPAGEGAGRDYEVVLGPDEGGEVEIRTGGMAIRSSGSATYRPGPGRVDLEGGVRAESDELRLRCERASIVLAEAGPEEAESAARLSSPKSGRKPGKGGGTRGTGSVRSAELEGSIVIELLASEGRVARRARAARASYDGEADTVVLSGTPEPTIESAGVVLAAPEIRLHVGENRIESSTGRMRMLVSPDRGPAVPAGEDK
jgi:lipopolysaccharide export system protein LptA